MAKVYNRLMFCFGMERVGLCLGILGGFVVIRVGKK